MRRLDGEDGSLATEAAFLMPMLCAVFFLIVQFGLWMYSDNVVTQAAIQGVNAVANAGPVTTAEARSIGEDAVNSFIAQASGVTDHRTTVTYPRGAAGEMWAVVVEVEAQPRVFVPFINLTMTSRSQGVVEKFVPRGGRP